MTTETNYRGNKMFANIEDAGNFGSDLAKEIKTYTSTRVVKPLEARIKALEETVARQQVEIERRNFAYHGVWKDGKVYSVGSFVTHSGALWHSNIFHNSTRPGDGNVAWTLAVKSGRDGKDGASK
jgi:hypothetical protein